MEKNWEHGSEFSLVRKDVGRGILESPWVKNGVLYGSGRDALRALIQHGMEIRGWKRLLIPSYFCQEVVKTLVKTGIVCELYRCSPINPCKQSVSGIGQSDVVLWVNYFGCIARTGFHSDMRDYDIIIDHSHDPWSRSSYKSNADYCMASLRKTLPIPDGGVIWSPLGHKMPLAAPLSKEREIASGRKLAAMVLKSYYLENAKIEKKVFRQLYLSGEMGIADGTISGISSFSRALISSLPIKLWRRSRQVNYKIASDLLATCSWINILRPEIEECVPFSLILIFNERRRRDYVKDFLIAARVFPVVLWPLEDSVLPGVQAEDRDFSRRMLAIPCDMRYSKDDMKKVASIVKQAGTSYDERKASFDHRHRDQVR